MQGGLRTSIQIFAWSYRRREGKCRWQSAVDELRPQVAVPGFHGVLDHLRSCDCLGPCPSSSEDSEFGLPSHDQNQSKMSSEVLLFANPLIK